MMSRGFPSGQSLFLIWLLSIALKFTTFASETTRTNLFIFATFILAIKTQLVYNQRKKNLELFDRGNVPSIKNTNFFSGNFFDLIKRGKVPQNIEKWHSELGKTFGIFYGPDPWIMTADLDLLRRLFITEAHHYIDITQFRSPYTEEIEESVFQVQGNKWRRLRRMLEPSFSHKQMKSDNVYKIIEDVTEMALDCLERHETQTIDLHGGQKGSGKLVDAKLLFGQYTLEAVYRIAFGTNYNQSFVPNADNEVLKSIREGGKLANNPLAWGGVMFETLRQMLRYLVPFTSIGKFMKAIHKSLDENVKIRRNLPKDQRDSDRRMIDTIIESFDAGKGNITALKANLFFILISGQDTSSNTLVLLFWLLARHPEKQDKLRESVILEGPKSKYLENCLKETMRLYPPVPSGIGRVIDKKIEHNGQTYYPGTTIVASIYAMHRMKEYWGDDVLEFKPERFDDTSSWHPTQYFAFGYGPRRCLGGNLAMSEMAEITSRILTRYKIDLEASTPEKEIDFTAPNLFHVILQHQMKYRFCQI